MHWSYHIHIKSESILCTWLKGWVIVYKLSGCGLEPVAFTSILNIASVSRE